MYALELPQLRGRVVAVLIAAIVLGTAGTAAWWRFATHAGGPLDLGGGGSQTGVPASVGQTITFGNIFAYNTAKADLKVLTVELIGTEDAAATVIDTRVLSAADRTGDWVGSAATYEPPPQATPAKGTVMHPGKPDDGPKAGYQILFGVRAERDGRTEFTGIRIVYEIGGVRYARTASQGLVVCTPPVPFCPKEA